MSIISHEPVSNTTIIFITATFAVWLVGLVAYLCLRQRYGQKRDLSVFIVLMGTFAAAGEAAYDSLIQFYWFNSPNGPIVYTAFGHAIPLWSILAYSAWIGTVMNIGYAAKRRRCSPTSFWKVFAAIVVIDFIAQAALHRFGLYTYGGQQGPRLLTVPIVWPIVYEATFLSIGVVAYYLESCLRGRRAFALVPLGAGSVLAGAAILGWPMILGIGAAASPGWMHLAAITTIAITLSWISIAAKSAGIPNAPEPLGNRSSWSTKIPIRRS